MKRKEPSDSCLVPRSDFDEELSYNVLSMCNLPDFFDL